MGSLGRRASRSSAQCRRKLVQLGLAYVCVVVFMFLLLLLPRVQPQTHGLPDPDKLADPCKARVSGSQHVDYIMYRRHHGACTAPRQAHCSAAGAARLRVQACARQRRFACLPRRDRRRSTQRACRFWFVCGFVRDQACVDVVLSTAPAHWQTLLSTLSPAVPPTTPVAAPPSQRANGAVCMSCVTES